LHEFAGEASAMNLRDKYNHAIQTAKGLHMEGAAEERDGKLYVKGMVKNQDEVNKIWDAIKTVPDWRNDIVAEIKVDPNAPKVETYTVKSGDTLSKIAKEQLGDANAYMKIFNANKDQLSDPDKIKPGQVLKIPTAA
jgi:nucleoid-associated protein YgaU